MAIDFKPTQWDKVKVAHEAWWAGKLDRMLASIVISDRIPTRAKPSAPLLTQATCNDFTISPEDMIDRIDYELSKNSYLGDAYPHFNMDAFGPGVVAAFLGAKVDNSTGRVWFETDVKPELRDMHFTYDPNNIYLNRIKEIYAAGMRRWQGQVLMGMLDLGGILDILATFRGSEALLMDLYDEPEEVKRLSNELHELWHRYYNEMNEVLMPVNPGYSDWSLLFSATPTYITQCDFAYMIGTPMFDEFVLPELVATSNRLSHTIYHLDGIGQLSHLDSLLTIGSLNAVQWQPGTGARPHSEWPEVYKKIQKAGKGMQLLGDLACAEKVARDIGTTYGIYTHVRTNDRDGAVAFLNKYC